MGANPGHTRHRTGDAVTAVLGRFEPSAQEPVSVGHERLLKFQQRL